ncbi:MAG: hypothetical protein HOF22_13690 [Verrucomicrobia bacterium]|nr:hypothetical protein [Verrucomicrobiota bacterium]
MKSESIIRDGYKGKVRFYEEWADKGKGTTRFRHCCRRNDVPKEDQWGTYDSWEEAEAGAAQIEAERLSQRGDQSDPAVIRAIQRGIINTKANARDAEGLLEDGFFLRCFMNDLNEFRESKGEPPLPSTRVFLCELKQSLESETLKKTKKEETNPYSKIIDEFIEWKTGLYGGRGNKELGGGAKLEWKTIAGYLKEPIGDYPVTSSKKDIRNAVVDGINKGTNNNNGTSKGESWSPQYKFRIAERAQTIGNWALKEEHITVNPMAELSKDFAHENDNEVQVFMPDVVQKIFDAAVELHNGIMVPYFTLLFYSTVRPEELADFQRAGERFFWKNMGGWKHNQRYLGRIGGLEFKVPKFEMINGVKTRRSKVATRQAFVTPTGMEWLRYYFVDLQGKALPNDDQIFASRKYRTEIKDAAGIVGGWPQDHSRHSLCSYGYYHKEFSRLLTDDDWHRASGHRKETFKKHYDSPQHQSDCTAYFGVLPPGTESLAAAIEENKRAPATLHPAPPACQLA